MIKGVNLKKVDEGFVVNGKPYPVQDIRYAELVHYVLYPVFGSDNQWRAAEVLKEGYINPENNPVKVVFATRDMCETACDINNDWVGFTKTEVAAIVKESMDSCFNSADLPQCPECLGETEQSELDLFGGFCEECFLDREEGGDTW